MQSTKAVNIKFKSDKKSSPSELDFFKVWNKLDLEKLKFQVQIHKGYTYYR